MGGQYKTDDKETGYEGVDSTSVAQDRDQWWAPVNTVIKAADP
jgi:hypothetical protein